MFKGLQVLMEMNAFYFFFLIRIYTLDVRVCVNSVPMAVSEEKMERERRGKL